MSASLIAASGPWLDSLKGLLFPPVCLICNRFMGFSVRGCVCPACRPQLVLRTQPACFRCGEYLNASNRCDFCEQQALPFHAADPLDGVFFLYRYGRAARRLVHRIKMTGDPRTGEWLKQELEQLPSRSNESFEAVVPIPSHRRSAPFAPDNGPSALWAETLASFWRVPVVRAVARSRTAPKQTSLNRADRLTASESSLSIRAGSLRGLSTVVLADDVMTTGATARACARALKNAGVRRVALAVIARG